jgi:hypothetical protein
MFTLTFSSLRSAKHATHAKHAPFYEQNNAQHHNTVHQIFEKQCLIFKKEGKWSDLSLFP